MKIPNNRPFLTNKEIEYVKEALVKGEIGGDGYYTRLTSSFIENTFNVKKVFMTTSGTHALEMAAILIDLQPGDEVVMPSYTFPSTANAVMLRGARPVFAEININTLNIDPVDIESKITPKTKAVIPVHYAGVGCEMDKIMDIAAKHNLYVIEDAAQAVNAQYKNKYLGTWGHMGCYSFHSTKNYTSGEGGALLFNENNKDILIKSEITGQKGTNRSQFLRGEVDRYCWVDIGSSYTPSDILMALLYSQLENMELITSGRKKIYNHYLMLLKKYAARGILKTMEIPADCKTNYHIFYILFSEEKLRSKAMKELNERGISASTHFSPLHSSPMGARLGYSPEDLKITEKASKCLLRLPMYSGMKKDELEYVSENLEQVLGRI